MMRLLFQGTLLSALFLFSGCHVPSRYAVEGCGGRTAYNQVLQETNSEQMLLNLVRLRYYDTPFFLNVGNITTQFTFKTSSNTSFKVPGFNLPNPVSIGGDISWQNQPTIQYTPLQGQAFAKQLLHPIDLSVMQHLILSGWNIDLVFRLAVQSFDEHLNAPEASGPIPEYVPRYESFFEVTDLLRFFQKRSELHLGIRVEKCKEGEGEKQLLQIIFPSEGEESEKLAKLLPGVKTENGHRLVTLELGYNTKGKVGIMPRSLLSCMYYLSTGIRLPKEHMDSGSVALTVDEGALFDWKRVMSQLMHIHCSFWAPKNAYVATKYKNYWFYIKETDLQSKHTFLLLLQLYNLQSEDKKGLPPILTLPLG